MTMVLFAALAALQSVPVVPPADGDQRIIPAFGIVYTGDTGDGGWFSLNDDGRHFRFPADRQELEADVRLLIEARERGISLVVHYDAMAGRADAEGGYIEYPLCSLSAANGAISGNERTNCPAPEHPRPETSEAALSYGVALAYNRPEEARRHLGLALGDDRLSPRLRALASRWRGEAGEQLATILPWTEAAFDRMTADALADYRAWLAATPDDMNAHYAVARMLADLGGYADAMAIYRGIERRWPDETFNIAIRTGALFRKQGRYAEALAQIDAYVANGGTQNGMKIRYHRGWTLQLLGRLPEAAAELSRGLESQPDYPSAYLMRSCAYSRMGRLAEALADQERGLELLENAAQTAMPSLVDELQRSRALATTLRRLVAAGDHRPTDVPCLGIWDRDEQPRARSPLLPSVPG
jgi:tetratricopeptide (TPR) repeat protein